MLCSRLVQRLHEVITCERRNNKSLKSCYNVPEARQYAKRQAEWRKKFGKHSRIYCDTVCLVSLNDFSLLCVNAQSLSIDKLSWSSLKTFGNSNKLYSYLLYSKRDRFISLGNSFQMKNEKNFQYDKIINF